MFEHGLSGRLWPVDGSQRHQVVLPAPSCTRSASCSVRPRPRRAGVGILIPGRTTKILLVLAAKTATPRTRVLATTVRGYRGYRNWQEDLRLMKRPPWLLRLGLRSLTRSRPWLQYCPRCLREDADPYFRLLAAAFCRRPVITTARSPIAVRPVVRWSTCTGFPATPRQATQCHDCRDRSAHAPILIGVRPLTGWCSAKPSCCGRCGQGGADCGGS